MGAQSLYWSGVAFSSFFNLDSVKKSEDCSIRRKRHRKEITRSLLRICSSLNIPNQEDQLQSREDGLHWMRTVLYLMHVSWLILALMYSEKCKSRINHRFAFKQTISANGDIMNFPLELWANRFVLELVLKYAHANYLKSK